MSQLVEYDKKGNIGIVRMDDGKANAVSPDLINAVNTALDQAEQDQVVVILTGRSGKFSAGFDLSVMQQGPEASRQMVKGGALLAARLLSFPFPVIIACNGHALAMGALLLAVADYRIGSEGNFKIGLNEVAIGMTMPKFGVEISRSRLTPMYLTRAVSNAEIFSPQQAVDAGFLDLAVPEATLMDTAVAEAERLVSLDFNAHHQTKLRVRSGVISAVQEAISEEFG